MLTTPSRFVFVTHGLSEHSERIRLILLGVHRRPCRRWIPGGGQCSRRACSFAT